MINQSWPDLSSDAKCNLKVQPFLASHTVNSFSVSCKTILEICFLYSLQIKTLNQNYIIRLNFIRLEFISHNQIDHLRRSESITHNNKIGQIFKSTVSNASTLSHSYSDSKGLWQHSLKHGLSCNRRYQYLKSVFAEASTLK